MIVNIVKLNKQLTALQTEKLETVKVMTSHEEKLKGMEEKLKTLEDENKTMVEKLKEFKKEEAAVVVAVGDSVNEKVVQKLAAMGVKEGTVSEEVVVATVSPQEIYKKYESLAGKDKIQFFKTNEKVIMKAMKDLHYQKPAAPINRF